MHGLNVIRKIDKTSDGSKLQVQGVWHTIQGEGPFAGWPAIFIRLTGCNLRCFFCDTVWDDDNDPWEDVEIVVEHVKLACLNKKTELVVITGGEPLAQNVDLLVKYLLAGGFRVQFETSGSVWRACVGWSGVTTVISPKVGIVQEFYKRNHMGNLFWKYIVRVSDKVEFSDKGIPYGVTQLHGRGRPGPPPEDAVVYLQACDEGPKDVDLTQANQIFAAELAMKYGYRVSVQLHKILEVD